MLQIIYTKAFLVEW